LDLDLDLVLDLDLDLDLGLDFVPDSRAPPTPVAPRKPVVKSA
jgi:hypothetical protein